MADALERALDPSTANGLRARGPAQAASFTWRASIDAHVDAYRRAFAPAVTLRVALSVEQLLDDAPGGIGRYVSELATRLPDHGVEVAAFTARHPRRRVDRAMRADGLDAIEPVILSLPRPLLYDAWHLARAFGPVPRVGPVDLVHAPSLAVPPSNGCRSSSPPTTPPR